MPKPSSKTSSPEKLPTAVVSVRESNSKQRILDAAVRCVERRGLMDVTIDDIVVESGVSRATVYRRYPNRELLLADLVESYFAPFEADGGRIMSSSASFSDRMEQIFIWSMTGLFTRPWLAAMFSEGMSAEKLALFNSMYGNRVHMSLRPHLERAKKNGELRNELDSKELIDWFLREMLLAFILGEKDKKLLSHKFRQYLLPVLVPDAKMQAESANIIDRVSQLEETTKAIVQTLESIRPKRTK
ncbi:MAG: TetR/AcrR family transcriptional regulator [Spongiibacteraceae bacterium]